MNNILNYLYSNKTFNNLLDDKKVIHCGNNESFAFYVLAKFMNTKTTLFVVMENLLACQNIFNKLSLMDKEHVYIYCVDETTKYTSLANSPELASQRLFILNKLLESEPIIVITHTYAFKRLTPSKNIFLNSCIYLKVNDESSINLLISKLIKIGYKNVFKVTQPFEFSTRGGVIDIFSINYNKPIRIEFFDTIIESIRFFDYESQRTIDSINQVKIIPATEFLTNNLENGIIKLKDFANRQINQSKNNLQLESIINDDIESLSNYDFNDSLYKYYYFFDSYSSIADYLSFKNVIIVNESKIIDNENFIENETYEDQMINFDEGLFLKDIPLFNNFKTIKNQIEQLSFASTDIENQILDLNAITIDSFDFNFELFFKQLTELILHHYTIYIGFNLPLHYNTFKEFLEKNNVSFNELDELNTLKEGINLAKKDLNIGLDFLDYKLYIIGENEIYKKRFKTTISQFSKYKNAITIDSINDLQIGDYLVHEHYGIGIYKGLETLTNNGIHRDYIKLEYKNEDVLYLPLEQFKLVRKYVSKDGACPKINKLGSKEWEKTKAKIKERVNEVAEKLVSLYSIRVNNNGFSFFKDDDLQIAFENDFPYPLTEDQEKVLNEIKNDMESNVIMDRLLVGDVGFGKTEIAFRAAFKAINSGKQVAFLCPTTLLARQHYLTAIDRFKNFGIRISLLSRLVSNTQAKSILKDLIEGKIDLLIGTHRLLSNDIVFKDIGLLIVDEEHKFGVTHKERIKEYKKNIDVLTLSATPIPRTLQMALTGIRGISTINTPIDNRMPVQTYVIRKEKRAIKEIIERELARNGQVYYLNNKIENLPSLANEINSLVKDARIAVAHGKLSVEQMENIMQRFINGEFNILLCTTIIENGIDIPNVNTIIVENADCFGLSQLYQIKGRVGRSNRLAYAYLMYNASKELSEIAKKRLQTIKEFTALGSGYKVAMRDLITRGAGDILGEEQSGFIESVGIDMYIEMLHNAIDKRRLEEKGNIEKENQENVSFNKMLNIDAYIPSNYFNNDYEKIDLYKRIDKIKTFAELIKLKDEIIDQSGKLPDSINLLFEKKTIDLFQKSNIIENYEEFDKYLILKLSKDFNKYKGIGVEIFELACNTSKDISLKFQHGLINCQIKKNMNWLYVANKFIYKLVELKQKYEVNENGH